MRFLDDVFEKTSTSMFSAMFRKTQNIMLTMHISDVFQTIEEKNTGKYHKFLNYKLKRKKIRKHLGK